jgi:hypothetical protein
MMLVGFGELVTLALILFSCGVASALFAMFSARQARRKVRRDTRQAGSQDGRR